MNHTTISALSPLGVTSTNEKQIHDRKREGEPQGADPSSPSGFLPVFATAINGLAEPQRQSIEHDAKPAAEVCEPSPPFIETDAPATESLPVGHAAGTITGKPADTQVVTASPGIGDALKQRGVLVDGISEGAFPTTGLGSELKTPLPSGEPQISDLMEQITLQQSEGKLASSFPGASWRPERAMTSEMETTIIQQLHSAAPVNDSAGLLPNSTTIHADVMEQIILQQSEGRLASSSFPVATWRLADVMTSGKETTIIQQLVSTTPVNNAAGLMSKSTMVHSDVNSELSATNRKTHVGQLVDARGSETSAPRAAVTPIIEDRLARPSVTPLLQNVLSERNEPGLGPVTGQVAADSSNQNVVAGSMTPGTTSPVQPALSRMPAQSVTPATHVGDQSPATIGSPIQTLDHRDIQAPLSAVPTSTILGKGERNLLYQQADQEVRMHGVNDQVLFGAKPSGRTSEVGTIQDTKGESKASHNPQNNDSQPASSAAQDETLRQPIGNQHRSNGSDPGYGSPGSEKSPVDYPEAVRSSAKPGSNSLPGALGESMSNEHPTIQAESEHGNASGLSPVNSMKSSAGANDMQPNQTVDLIRAAVKDTPSADYSTVVSRGLGMDNEAISSLISENLVRGISSEIAQRLRDGVSELTLQLKPEFLGEMRLKVGIVDEKVTAQVHVTGSEVKAALEANIVQLRDGLASRGIEVQRIEIYTVGDAPARESRGQQEARQRASSRRRDGDSVEERYKGTRLMGYNTIEMVM